MGIDRAALISGLMDFLFIFIFSLLGAIIKDTYNTLTDKDTKVKISRIIISTIVSSVLLFSLSDYLVAKISPKLFILPCFIGGMVGFELMGKIRNLSFWIKVYRDKKAIVDELIKKEIDNNPDDKDNEDSS